MVISFRSFTSSGQSVFCQFEDDEMFEEYYDLDLDPWQLDNLAMVMEVEQLAEERLMLSILSSCSGIDCQIFN